MIVKKPDTREKDLIAFALDTLPTTNLSDSRDQFVPYIDMLNNEIRYLHFVQVNGTWLPEFTRNA